MAGKRTASKKGDSRRVAFNRFMFIVALLVLWIGGISWRLVDLQITQHDWLKERAIGQRRDHKKSKLPRGTIYDRNERVLAMSVKVNTLYADAMRVEDVAATAKDLAKLLDLNEKELRTRLAEAKELERRFVPLKKGIDAETADRINKQLDDPKSRKADLPRYQGLHWREDQQRSYPYERLAAHVVGFSDAEGVGQAGIEQSQNENLYGAVIRKVQERDRLGRVYDETVSDKEPSKDVVLTLSHSIQYKTEQALEKAVKSTGSKSGIAIVISNKTGEILAMANYPTFDPNDMKSIGPENLNNHAIQSMYSPGSVFKLVTYGAALERDLFDADGEIDGGSGVIQIGKRQFKDSRALGRISYKKAMAVSSNVCAIKTSMKVGKEGFHASITNFGFGSATGIELPAETSGVVRPVERWYGDSLASMAIGYEIGVSALQMATAFATIANNGVRVQPHIIKEIRNADATIFKSAQPEKTRVVSAATARGLKSMLKEVVISGTGKSAQLDNHSAAGKTGTAWKFDEKIKRINPAKYVSSFIGFAPADNPEVTIAVVMDEPKFGGRGGGAAAGPVFKEIGDAILSELGVQPDKIGGVVIPREEDEEEEIQESVGDGQEIEVLTASANESLSQGRPSIAEIPKTPKPSEARKPLEPNVRAAEPPEKKPVKPPVTAAALSGATRKRIETENRN
ncbi:MAG: penicillin-binding protein 2 [Blastocatellia bacterium]|nr:penicillin-binding protein 2 [Blastocatellia bacterium]